MRSKTYIIKCASKGKHVVLISHINLKLDCDVVSFYYVAKKYISQVPSRIQHLVIEDIILMGHTL